MFIYENLQLIVGDAIGYSADDIPNESNVLQLIARASSTFPQIVNDILLDKSQKLLIFGGRRSGGEKVYMSLVCSTFSVLTFLVTQHSSHFTLLVD